LLAAHRDDRDVIHDSVEAQSKAQKFGGDTDMIDITSASDMTVASSNAAKMSSPIASQVLAMAAKGKYETPRIDTHRLDGAAKDGPLAMSGNI
jgi:hypothetical protein